MSETSEPSELSSSFYLSEMSETSEPSECSESSEPSELPGTSEANYCRDFFLSTKRFSLLPGFHQRGLLLRYLSRSEAETSHCPFTLWPFKAPLSMAALRLTGAMFWPCLPLALLLAATRSTRNASAKRYIALVTKRKDLSILALYLRHYISVLPRSSSWQEVFALDYSPLFCHRFSYASKGAASNHPAIRRRR